LKNRRQPDCPKALVGRIPASAFFMDELAGLVGPGPHFTKEKIVTLTKRAGWLINFFAAM